MNGKQPQLRPIIQAGLMTANQSGVAAASGSKSQRTTIRNEAKHMHADATKLPKR